MLVSDKTHQLIVVLLRYEEKSFITLPNRGNLIKLFMALIYELFE
jgi:hypothetical protein